MDTRKAGSLPAWLVTYSVLPPPMSITSVCAPAARPLVAPRKVNRASSSPEMVRGSMPKRAPISSRKARPFSASRMALVATATTRSAPRRSITSR